MRQSNVHLYETLITIFNECFLEKFNTRLVKGENEPLYRPANDKQLHHELIFAHGFYASALHECSHWLIAGDTRRQLVDFGYWYEPDGRTAQQQALFLQAEIKPQALEWILSIASGFRFRISIDNLNGSDYDTEQFKLAVYQQVKHLCEVGLSDRAAIFRHALCDYYQTSRILKIDDFDQSSI